MILVPPFNFFTAAIFLWFVYLVFTDKPKSDED